MQKTLKIGTRGSKLALWQAQYVAAQLSEAVSDLEIELKVIKTKGDKILDTALAKIGDKGLFTKEIEKELLNGDIDAAVHSMKDLPSVMDPGLCLGATVKREIPGDVLISLANLKFAQLPQGAVLGTSSLRRQAQIKAIRPDIQLLDIRGNVETRIAKMRAEGMDGIVLAYAGVKRLGYEKWISDLIDYDVIMPAVGQGAIAVQVRSGDREVLEVVQQVNHRETDIAVRAERSFLAELEGGCQVPIGALARIENQQLVLKGTVASLDGSRIIRDQNIGRIEEPEKYGKILARNMIAAGAGDILRQIRGIGD